MSVPQIISLVVSLVIIIGLLIALYFLGKRQQKKRDEQQAAIDSSSQWTNMLIIDKKKMKIKDSGLPKQVIDQTPWYAKRSKVAIVKAKVGPQIAIFIADNDVFDMIPVKKEIRAKIAGLYISEVKGIRCQLEKPVKKKNFFQSLAGQK